MNNPFTKATDVQRYVKALVYGASGTGKTWFALNSPRPCAMIDLEGGSAHYANHPVIGGFDRISTKSLADIEKAILFCEDGHYKTLVIDPITLVWSLLQDAAMEVIKRRNKGRKDEIELALTPRDWGAIKRKNSSLMTALVNLPCHVIMVARQKEIVRVDASGNMEVTGTKPDAEKNTPYLPDVVMELQISNHKGKGGNDRFAIVHKDRTGTFDSWQKVIKPELALWLPKANTTGQAERLQPEDEIARANADYFEAEAPRKRDNRDAPQQERRPAPVATQERQQEPSRPPQYDPPPEPSRRNARPVGGPVDTPPTPDWKQIWIAARDVGLSHDDVHDLMGVASLKDCDPDDLRDLPGTLRMWSEQDEQAGMPHELELLARDLIAAKDLEDMAGRWKMWKAHVNGTISKIGIVKATAIKEAAKATRESEQQGEEG